MAESAVRYLGIEHGHQAVTAHRSVVEHLRSLSRRRGDKAWRLVGLTIRVSASAARPDLDDFIAERDLDGWSEAEVQQLYAEAYPADQRAERRQRLRERQIALLKELQQLAAETPLATDRIDGWFDPVTARRLEQAGLLLLGDLQRRVALGGHWWRGLPAIGKTKAARLAHHLATLLPPALGVGPRRFDVPPGADHLRPAGPDPASPFTPDGFGDSPAADALKVGPAAGPEGLAGSPGAVASLGSVPALPRATPPQRGLFDGRPVSSGAPGTAALTGARDDGEVIEAWVAARAGSLPTARSYRREALRLLLWLQHERHKGFVAVQVDDCLAYMAFLEHLPPDWVSRRHSTVLGEGWAPFRGPLSLASRRQAVVILGGFFAWMVDVGYLPGRNPWMLINRRTGDDAQHDELDSRAFTPEAWAAILAHLKLQPPGPSRERMLFLLTFVEATGLRASEIVGARLSAFRRHRGRWAMQVHGKGARNRVIAVPGQAEEALNDYLAARGLPWLGEADPEVPLLASTLDPLAPIGYQALYQTLKRWVSRAISASDLPRAEREDARRASPHWLRHTFGTRALERHAPLEVVQRQLGHADPRTTMRYAKAQLERLQAEMDQAFGREPARPPDAPEDLHIRGALAPEAD